MHCGRAQNLMGHLVAEREPALFESSRRGVATASKAQKAIETGVMAAAAVRNLHHLR